MKNKKLLSTVVASALVATMAMPVMAADGGEVEVDVNTRTAVIRVEVPTALEVAVNQFEKGDTGSQIYSEPFGIKNKSEIPVKVSITSTASLADTNPISLVATKAAAASSTATGGEAWLAIAAQTSAGKYIEDGSKGIGDLTDTDRNVTTFVTKADNASAAAADQIFYLNAVTNPTVTYKKLAPTDADELKTAKNTSYAQIHEVEAITFTGSDTATKQGELNTKIAAGNVYKIVTTGSTDTITLIEKGKSETLDETAGTVYYEDKGVVLRTAMAENKIYVYGEAGDGGSTAFRYIGKLGEGKETWTKDDIKHIQIAYDIAGITATKYTEVSSSTTNPLINGLYKEAPVIAYVSGKDNGDVVLKINMPTGKTLATNYTKINGVNVSTWSTYSSKVIFNSTDNTVKIVASAFAFNTVADATTDHKYTFTFKDTAGTEYESAEMDLTPAS